MSETSRAARAAMRAKAHRLAGTDAHQKVDASDFTPAEPMNADSTVGMKPLSRRQYRKGGKVVEVHGEHERVHAGRRARKDGGRLAESLMNRDQKEANGERPGGKDHVGGYKHGGRAHRDAGGPLAPQIAGGIGGQGRMQFQNGASQMSRAAGFAKGGHADEAQDRKLVKRMVKPGALRKHGGEVHDPSCACDKCNAAMNGMRPEGGREARARGGETEHDGKWIKGAISHPGALHRELHVPEGKKIPAHKLEKAEHSHNKLIAKRAHLAETLEHMPRARGGKTGKGKTAINIVIAPGQGGGSPQGAPPMPPQGMMPQRPPVMTPPPQATPMGGVPMGAGAPPMPPQDMPPQGMMPRRHGGRTEYEGGAGGGRGRREKIAAYGDKA